MDIDVNFFIRDFDAFEKNLSFFRDFQHIQTAQERTFATSGRADNGNNLLRSNVFADALKTWREPKLLCKLTVRIMGSLFTGSHPPFKYRDHFTQRKGDDKVNRADDN